MGEVYRARDTQLGRDVALKVLPERLAADPAFKARFEREARAVAALSHPNILAIHALGSDAGRLFAVMELLPGETLREMLASGRVPFEQAVACAVQITRGLASAHERGIVHRDLKPENVMVAPGGSVKILDFGLAKPVEEMAAPPGGHLSQAETEDGLTKAGTVLGTTAYMSPEQARGQRTDTRSDLFSLGVLLYELLTGRNPFRGPTAADTLGAILRERPRPPSEIDPDMPPALDGLIERLLSKEPADRPSADVVVAELTELQTPAPAVRAGAARPPEALRSIAVLPFADMSPGKDQDYFCEGLAEELINALAHVAGLRVATRTSAFRFKARADDVRRIGQQLGVETVLEGSVRKAGKRLRVTAQLVDARDGYHLWSERYDRDLEDVFALQDEITTTIVETLRLKLAGAVPSRPRAATGNVDAYQLYLQGRYWWNKRNEGGLWKGISFFAQAIEKDPSYARAHCGLADSYSVIGFYCFLPPSTAFAKASESAARALALDEGLAEAHVSVAFVRYWFDFDWPGAEQAFRRSLGLRPDNVIAHVFLGQLLSAIGRPAEADVEWRIALSLDPMSPLNHGIVGSGLYFSRRFEAGLDENHKALELDPNHVQSLWSGSNNAAQLGRFDEAIDLAQRAVALSGRAPMFLGALGQHLARAGRKDAAQGILDELEARASQEYIAPVILAAVQVGLGRKDRALELLEQAFAERNSFLIALVGSYECDVLKDEPRFQALLNKMKLSPR